MIDEKQLREAIETSISMRTAAKLLNADYQVFKKYAKSYGIFVPNQGRKGRIGSSNTKMASEILVERSDRKKVCRGLLYRSLLEIGREYKCAGDGCNLGPIWNGQPLQLQVDHINGKNYDNRPDNLRFLCPNCHSQTPTFGNKGAQKRYRGGMAYTSRSEREAPSEH